MTPLMTHLQPSTMLLRMPVAARTGDARNDQDFKHGSHRVISGHCQYLGSKRTEELRAHAKDGVNQGALHDGSHHLPKPTIKPLGRHRKHQHCDEKGADTQHDFGGNDYGTGWNGDKERRAMNSSVFPSCNLPQGHDKPLEHRTPRQ